MQPSSAPSYLPSLSPTSLSMQPSSAPSYLPSFSPTSRPECPEQLLKFTTLDDDGLLTLRYEVVHYEGDMFDDLGGLLCISLEYTGTAGWIGLAFSEATRNPQFGRKEAIIGIPGIKTSVTVATDGSASLGQQIYALEGGPVFRNPGKYEIPAGGIEDGFSGPSLNLLSDIHKQTLINGSVSMLNAYLETDNDAVSDFRSTKLSFAKYLREPEEIEIDPYESTLLLYVVAPLDNDGGYDGNPEWKYTYLNLLDSSPDVVKSGFDRKRKRPS
mmetsp:Transcript_34799/g.62649  ORF Transcript_34799/g.62649 Transcript_34799/m.62649 type:complete len:271 (-) Transcript_34799:692-1504(-)